MGRWEVGGCSLVWGSGSCGCVMYGGLWVVL